LLRTTLLSYVYNFTILEFEKIKRFVPIIPLH
jgi:hypothetical protein